MLTARLSISAPLFPAPSRRVPMLENGAELSAAEFMRRYDSAPGVKKAELIDNTVYIMASPLRADQHGDPDNFVQGWLFHYAVVTPGVRAATNATTRLSADDVPQPDASLRLLPEYGGATWIDEDGYINGPPEVVVEVAASTASIDLHRKLNSYRRAGVREYLVWRTEEGAIDWWQLVEDEYRPLSPAEDGTIRSLVFPGLWLDPQALVTMDGARLLAALGRGIAGTEHATWLETLRSRVGKTPALGD